MANPAFFDYEVYMNNKLVQMQKAEPATGWTLPKLMDVFAQNGFVGAEGAYAHFTQFGAAEDVAPNASFNANEYYAAKAAQFYSVEPKAVTEFQIANVKQLINAAGMNAWTHYQQFGSAEGVNPSNSFDADAYCAAKAVAMGDGWTAEKIADAIKANNMTVLDHYLTYAGKGEGEVAEGTTFPVPDDKKVPSDVTGKKFTLTVNVDNVVGTSADDIINAPLHTGDGVANQPTLSVGDNIDGGAGTDTLNVWGGNFNGVAMKNVEIVNHQVAGDLNVSAYADVKEVWQNASQGVLNDNTTTAQLTTKVGFGGTSTGAQKVTFTKADGTADAATVALNGVNMTSVEVSEEAANAIEAQTLNLTGKNTLTTFTNAKMTSLTITGDGSLAGAAGAAVTVAAAGILKSIDATANTGGVNLSVTDGNLAAKATIATGSGNDTIVIADAVASVELGAGDDKLTMNAADFVKANVLNGGEGTDTLILAGTDFTATKDLMTNVSNFEVLGISGAKLTADAKAIGFNAFSADGTSGALELTNVADGSDITFGAGAAAASSISMASGAKSVDLFLAGSATAIANLSAGLTLKGVSTLNVDSSAKLASLAANKLNLTTADENVSVNLTGDHDVVLSAASTTTGTKGYSINAVDFGGKMTALGSAKADAIIGSAQADKLWGGAGQDTLTGGAGADQFVLATAASMVAAAGANMNSITDFKVGEDKFVFDVSGNITGPALTDAGALLKGVTFTAATAKMATMNDMITSNATVATLADVYTQLDTVLTDTNFAASNAAGTATVAQVVKFTTGDAAGTYLVINDATANFAGADDVVINITGIEGMLSATDFIFA